ncbi:MAG TPA: hypothetical protein VMA72_07210 [Streptosporangiaceae bacterium]|nr:hypothetical protein [Streptosporangiaceae bacterium]
MLAFTLAGAAWMPTAAASTARSARTAASHSLSSDAGYTVTGRHLNVVETWVTLPKPSRFAADAGLVGASVQLWSATSVIDLRVAACTDATCRAGGKPVNRGYHAVLDVFDRATHALECSTTGTGSHRCPPPIGSFSKQRIKPGANIMMWITYTIPYDAIMVGAGPSSYTYWLPTQPSSKPGIDFMKARIAAEFGTSPWASPNMKLRRSKVGVRVMSFDRPKPPPYAAEIGDIADHDAGIASRWWKHARNATHPGRAYAAASSLWDDGYGFSVYLKRS